MDILDTVRREWAFVSNMHKVQKRVGDRTSGLKRTIADEFENAVETFKRNVAVRYNGRLFTYEELDSRANQYADWGLKQGYQPRDCVALLMQNRPDYIAFWFGMSKIGVTTALLNYNLQSKGLAHCLKVSSAKALIIGHEQAGTLQTVSEWLDEGLVIWSVGGEVDGVNQIDPLFGTLSTTRPAAFIREDVIIDDTALLVFTSGTTGLPKAAKLTHARALGMMLAFINPCKITPRDRIYSTLPLYHATAGVCGVGQALFSGASLIIKEKFSAKSFWSDAMEEGATSIIYIGELCRYLVDTPETKFDRAHTVRTGFGNGLRGDVWEKFVDRFGVKHLVEFYGSTEGNISLINFDGKIGAIGRLPDYFKNRLQYKIVKFDIDTELPIRDADGFCIEAEPNEAGEAIGLINANQRYDGYSDAKQTESKVLRDVFEPGDLWFRSGDLLKKDEQGYIYFVDRIGDTFRWKGENVSTHEVAEVLTEFEGLQLPNVYGVEIPNTDGRAGMAAIHLEGCETLDGEALATHVDKALPMYARPLFIRIQPEAETTGTFKFKKVDLVNEGFDVDKVGDPLIVRLPNSNAYTPLTAEIYEEIRAGNVKF